MSFVWPAAGETTANRPERQANCHLATAKELHFARVRQNWFSLAFILGPYSRERNRACFENRVPIRIGDWLLPFGFIILCFVRLLFVFASGGNRPPRDRARFGRQSGK